MKNKSLVLLVALTLFLFPAVNFAQSDQSSEGISGGFKVGANLSNVYDSDNEDFQADSKIGFAGGAFLSIPFGKYLGIQPEILFSQKGFKGSGSILGSEYSFSRTTNYIDVPILLAIKPISSLTLLVGPQYSYLMSQKYVFKSAMVNIEQQQQFENEDIRTNTLCITGGFDVNLTNIVLSARTGWDLQNNTADEASSTPRYKNMWYQVTVGYRF